MAHVELQLLSYIISKGALTDALNWGIQDNDFLTDEGRSIFNTLTYALNDPKFKRGQFGKHAIRSLFPDFVKCHDKSMTLDALCTQVREQRLKLSLQAVAREILTGTGGTSMDACSKAIDRLQRNVMAVGYGQHSDVHFADSLDRALQVHDRKNSGEDLSVCQWPWPLFHEQAGGVEKDDYIVLYGRPKSKKSWMLAYFIASMFMQGKFPLIYTKEMTADNLFMRVAACLAKIPYQNFRRGQLTREQRLHMADILRACRDIQQQQDMVSLDGKESRGGGDTVEWLHAKVEKYKPDIVFIDGLYLLSNSRGGKGQKDNFRVQDISRDVRQMVLSTGRPVVATIQATRTAAAHKNANLDEIAFSDAIGQDVTAAIRVINEDRSEEFQGHDVASLVVGGSREWRFSGCRIFADCAECFDDISLLDEREVLRVKERDDRVDAKDTGNSTGAVRTPSTAKSRQAQVSASTKRAMDSRLRDLTRYRQRAV